MRLKRFIAIGTAIMISSMSIIGCETKTSKNNINKNSTLKVGMISDINGVNDNSYNESVLRALKKAQKDLGVKFKVIESKNESEYSGNVNGFINEGTDLIIGVGNELKNHIKGYADKLPKQKFVVVDRDYDKTHENIIPISLKKNNKLTGFIAGKTTDEKTLNESDKNKIHDDVYNTVKDLAKDKQKTEQTNIDKTNDQQTKDPSKDSSKDSKNNKLKGENNSPNENDIDKNIYALKYDPNQILAYNGEKIENFVPKEGREEANKYIVIEREKKSISDSTADISIIDSINDRTYPGALQLANRNLVENKPDILACKRKPLTISIDLPGMSGDNSLVVNSPTNSSVNSAIDTLLDTWNTKHADKYTIPTKVNYLDSMVYSKAQLTATFGCNFNALNKSLNIDFEAVTKGEKQIMFIAYKQIFYTVSVDAPNKPSDLFDESVAFAELSDKGVNNDNPPAYVSNVAYGRTIYVKLETDSKSSNVKAAFKALVNNQDVKSNAEYMEILNQSTFTATVLGGGAEQHNVVVSKNFDDIRNAIKDNAVYSPKNPGYPISYTTTFLKNNAIANVNNKTEYIETKTTEYQNGKITLKHTGGYVAQFRVTWDEVTYDENGKEIVSNKAWEKNDWNLTAPFSSEIPLKGNARNICAFAKEATGLAWEPWRTVFDAKNIPLVKERTFWIWGTTLNQQCTIDPSI